MSRTPIVIIIAWLLVVLGLLMTPGCDRSKESLLADMNYIYMDLRIIITDPAVLTLLSPGQLQDLKQAETSYLAAVEVLRGIDAIDSDSGHVTFEIIAGCVDTILDTIDTTDIFIGHEVKVAAIRMTLKILRNHIR